MITKENLKKIWEMCINYDIQQNKIADWLEELIDWYAIIKLPHPIEVLKYTDPELYDILWYVLWEISNMKDWGTITYPNWTELKLTYDFESLLKYCEIEWIIIEEQQKNTQKH